ncbi:unnamed protein product [Moneuplotes crassus]|uniref:Impact N-terminal domain-containing protein n=2 Tax=Euplotes crassus TaxID=5936 RepID=A0AAD1Y7G1_EUPCR|nr:unnamed protein product [Moneuplotes crassus]
MLASSREESLNQKSEIVNNKMSIVGSLTNKHDKVIYKAFAVAIICQDDIDTALEQISKEDNKFFEAKNVIMAYRINSPEEVLIRSKNGHDIVEGFDNGDLEGCGEKLLHLLQRIAVENILIIVAISYYGIKGSLRIGSYSHCINIARDLLTSLHNKAVDYEETPEGEGEENQEYSDTQSVLKDTRNRIRLSTNPGQNRVTHFKNPSQRISFISNQRKHAKSSQNRITINANYPIRNMYSPQSISENDDSTVNFQNRSIMSPHFGERQEIDSSNVMPRVFNFPGVMGQNAYNSNRPNTYYSDLAAANSKFSNTSRRRKNHRGKNQLNKTGIQLEASGKKIKYSFNEDLNFNKTFAFASDPRKRVSFGQGLRAGQINYSAINSHRKQGSYTTNRERLNKTANKISPHLPRISDHSPLTPMQTSTNEVITEEGKLTTEKKLITKLKKNYQHQQENLKAKEIEAQRMAKMKGKSDLEGLEPINYQSKVQTTKKPVFSMIPRKMPSPKPGNFLQPKRLVLTDYKVLVPSAKAAPTVSVFNMHENLPESDSREHLDEVEIPDIDLTNYDNASLGFILNGEVERPKFRIHDVRRMMDEVPTDINRLENYIDRVELDEKPTNVLVKLAEQCKRRRRKLYKDLRNPDSSSSSSEESEENEMISNFKAYRIHNRF